MSKEAIKQALEAMQFALHVGFDESSERQIKKGDKAVQQHKNAITALRKALANEALDKMAENARELGLDYEPAQQEPVGEVGEIDIDEDGQAFAWLALHKNVDIGDKLYTSPPAQRTWVSLTDEQMLAIVHYSQLDNARAIEAKLKEKNT